MKIDLKGILKGALNSVFVKESVEKIAEERDTICKGCEFDSDNAKKVGYKTERFDRHCTDCGCNLHMKTRCLSCECPVKKWLKVLSEDEDNELQKKLKNG